jgi:hypothetical protein
MAALDITPGLLLSPCPGLQVDTQLDVQLSVIRSGDILQDTSPLAGRGRRPAY